MMNRIRIYGIILSLSFLILIGRLFYWQIIKGDDLSSQARSQYISDETLKAERGNILASDGTWLVANGEEYLLFANPQALEDDPEKIAEIIAPHFVQSEERSDQIEEVDRIEKLLKKNDAKWVPIKSRINSKLKETIESFEIAGLGFEAHPKREYPEASTAAHLLGFVGKDSEGNNKGYFGLEGYYDLSLQGKEGYVSRESDAFGLPILLGNTREISAIGGIDLVTHLNKRIQLNLEQKLQEGIERYGAKDGNVVVMDPRSGAVLAMSAFPTYDPEKYYNYSNELFSNPIVSSTFEPGSIFKVVVMASALDAGVITPNTPCNICAGPLEIDNFTIGTWNDEYHPNSTMTDVIVHSDNVGMAFVGMQLGSDKLYDYLKSFGIGELTGIDLQGESTARLREKDKWKKVDLATATFGQGIAVTPIQMLTAVGAIANDGVLVSPQIVDKIKKDGWEEDIEPDRGRRVISAKAADQITQMMVEAARNGEAKWTHSKGFKVAGKTGTAQIPIAGHYDKDKTIASFVGFAPYDDPKFVMLVTLREPATSPWASETAAPLWYDIAQDLFLYYGIQPNN